MLIKQREIIRIISKKKKKKGSSEPRGMLSELLWIKILKFIVIAINSKATITNFLIPVDIIIRYMFDEYFKS